MTNIPKNLHSSLWSYDVSKLNNKRDANLIITQLLNYGGEEGKDWVWKNYSDKDIKQTVEHPQRGTWNRNVLRETLNKADLTIDPLEYEAAIRNLVPPAILIEEVWKRKGLSI